ncbi:MAG: recombination-associated protein RdgC [Pseudomonadales bacterium]
MFRNLRLYRLTGTWPESENALSELLERAAFKPCSAYSERSAGWEPPTGDDDGLLCRRVGGADLLRLRVQTRLLPGAAVNEALEERVEAFRGRMQRDPGRVEKRQLRDEVIAELMPRALTKSERVRGFCLLQEKLIGVDTASAAQAERFLDALRDGLGSLPVTPLEFKKPIGAFLTRVFLGDGPGTFRAGRECRMQDAAAGAATVSWMDIDLADADVQRHVRHGLKLTRLAVQFEELLGCVIDEDGVLRKLKLTGLDAVEDREDEDPLARLDAEFTLLVGVYRRLHEAMKKELGGLA